MVNSWMSSALSSSNYTGCAQLDFILQDGERSRQLLDYETVRRIENLFSVQLRVSPSSPGEWVTLLGREEDNKRAKVYIMALCEPEFHRELTSGGSMFSTILYGDNSSSVRNELEHKYQTVITTSASGILVQGNRNNVLQTVENLSVPNGHLPQFPTSDSRVHEPPPPPLPQSTVHLQLPSTTYTRMSGETTFVNSSSSRQQNIDQQLRDALQQEVIGTLPDNLKRELLDRLIGSGTGSRPQVPVALPPTPAVPSSIIPRAIDERREQRINAFVRLDYPRQKVEAVLDSLGLDAPDDSILARLVKVCRTPAVNSQQRYGGLSKSRPRTSYGELLPITQTTVDPSRLRYIVIDGSNVAMRHGNGKVFSCRGIQLAVDYFRQRGHTQITVFVPEWRKESPRQDNPISEQEILYSLEREEVLRYTPSRRVQGRRIVCYDDRFIVKLAYEEGGAILSNDQYRDLMEENQQWREVIEQRLIQFTFVNDRLMIPDDPLGRFGPTLDQILHKGPRDIQIAPQPVDKSAPQRKICPYLETGCTFGRKCKYYHPERDQAPAINKTPSASRSATPSPSPDKSLLLHPSRISHEDLRPASFVDDQSQPPSIDISSLPTQMSRLSIQHSSPHKQHAERDAAYSLYHENRTFVPSPNHTHPKPQSINLSPPPPQELIYSRSSPALPSSDVTTTPLEGSRPHVHTFPMATLNQAPPTRQKTADLTRPRQSSSQCASPMFHPSAIQDPNDPNRLHLPPLDHQYAGAGIQTPVPLKTREPIPNVVRGGDLRVTPGYPPSSTEPYHQPYSGIAPSFSPPLHGGQGSSGNCPVYIPRGGPPDVVPYHHNSSMLHPPPPTSLSYHPHHPHQYHTDFRPSGGRRSVDYGPPSNLQLHERFQHRRSSYEPSNPGYPLPSSSYAPTLPHSQQLYNQSSSSGGGLLHAHSFSHITTQYSAMLSPVGEVHYSSGTSGFDGGYVQPNQSEVEPILNETMLHRFNAVFPGCEDRVRRVMLAHPNVTDIMEFESLLKQLD